MEEKLVYLNKELICDDVLFVNEKETRENGLLRKSKYIILYVTENYEIKKIILTLKYIYEEQYVSLYKYYQMTLEQQKEARPFLDNSEYISTEILIENDDDHFIADTLGFDQYKSKYIFPGKKYVSSSAFFKKREYNDYNDTAKGKYRYLYYFDVINYKKWLEKSKAQTIDPKLNKEFAVRPSYVITDAGRIVWLKTIDDIVNGSYSNIKEIEALIYKNYASLCPMTFEPEESNIFVSKEIDPYIGSRKFSLQIVRSPETPQKAFDYIKVEFTVITKVDMEWLKTNYKPIAKKAIQFIENNKHFCKFGVPSNILKLENITLSRDKTAIFTFGVKDISSKE